MLLPSGNVLGLTVYKSLISQNLYLRDGKRIFIVTISSFKIMPLKGYWKNSHRSSEFKERHIENTLNYLWINIISTFFAYIVPNSRFQPAHPFHFLLTINNEKSRSLLMRAFGNWNRSLPLDQISSAHHPLPIHKPICFILTCVN